MSAFSALSLILSPSCKSIARLRLPSRLELKRPERVLHECTLGEGHLHGVLVRLTGADDPVVRPDRDAHHPIRRLLPLPLLDHLGIGLLDQRANSRQRLVTPVTSAARRRSALRLRDRLCHVRPATSACRACTRRDPSARRSGRPTARPRAPSRACRRWL